MHLYKKFFRSESQQKKEFEIEKILWQKNLNYLIKWEKYFTSKNTWESLDNLKNY